MGEERGFGAKCEEIQGEVEKKRRIMIGKWKYAEMGWLIP